MYAIIETGGKQYKVSEGEEISIEKLDAEVGDKVTFDKVIAVSDGSLKVAGDVASSSVDATVLDQGRGRKVVVYKYKRKTGYHKKNGHRQPFTKVRIDSIKA
ncbi:MAG: 50S ribosomal protein L21 [Lachnospiraceae bacterium]|nr:50S ribosomal protein L21 [Lachnospiraceae bacterium]